MTAAINQISFETQQVINQLDGFYGVFGLDSECRLLNQTAANWLGFKSPEQGIGRFYEDIQAPAVESAEFFRTLDTMVLTQEKRIYYLGYFGYNDGFRVIHGMKAPYLDEKQNIIGINCHFQDVTHLNSINKDHLIFQPDYVMYNDNKCEQFCYLFLETEEKDILSEREKECLFFLLRRKTAREISEILCLSPRTVEDHIDNIRHKLNCSSKSDLIEKATLENFGNQLPMKYLKMLWKK